MRINYSIYAELVLGYRVRVNTPICSNDYLYSHMLFQIEFSLSEKTSSTDRSTVAIVKGSDPFTVTAQALKLVREYVTIQSNERVLIKPNCVMPVAPKTGVTTDSGVVEAVIEFLQGNGVWDIVIAEGGNPGTDKAFKVTGLKKLEKKLGVELVNLNKDTWEEVTIPRSVALKKVKIAKTVLECDRIINVPKLKIQHMAQVTLSLKNLMGVIVGNRGLLMHDKLDEKIVDLASLFKPVLNVVDGLVGSEMDEVVGNPVKSNVVITGVDMVSVDTVGSAVMGLDASKVRHIQMATMRGLGIANLDRINVIGEPIEAVMTSFSTEYSDTKLKSYGLSNPLSEADIDYIKNSFSHRDPHVEDPYRRK